FFFQAEDGIRDATVTGVQTCALPILERELAVLFPEKPVRRAELPVEHGDNRERSAEQSGEEPPPALLHHAGTKLRGLELVLTIRSEERRVGNACRCWRGRELKRHECR